MPDIVEQTPGARSAAFAARPRTSRGLDRALPLLYLLLAMLFMTFYTVRTTWMLPWGIDGLTYLPPYPFRYRILATLVPGALAKLTHARLEWLYAVQGTLFVWGTLLVYRRLLARHMRADLAGVLAPGLLYGMTWHYCAMNLLYFAFDMPAVFFFVLGWYLLLERRWALYYLVFALAVFNRETCLALTGVFALVEFRRMPARALLAHVAAQTCLWVAIKAGLWMAFAPQGHQLYFDSLETNRQTLFQLLTMRGIGPKTAAKFLLWCGGLWAALPFLARRQPEPIRRSLLVIAPFFLGMVFVGTLREMRIYGELIPIVTTPCLVWVARQLDPAA
jgi:hypothetical protein